MRLFVCTTAHPPRIHINGTGLTSLMTTEWVVHTDVDRSRLARHLGVSRRHVHVCNPPPIEPAPISWNRDWVCRNLVSKGEWMAWADDDMRGAAAVPEEFYHCERMEFGGRSSSELRRIYGAACPAARLVHLFEELADKCSRRGTVYGGFAPEDNYFHRPKHWRGPTGYVKTGMAVYKNDGSSWYPFDGCMWEDYVKSADVVARYGRIVINNFVRPVSTYWEPGGIGTLEERRPYWLKNIEWMIGRWPGLLVQDSAVPTNVHFALRTEAQVRRWRLANGYLSLKENSRGNKGRGK